METITKQPDRLQIYINLKESISSTYDIDTFIFNLDFLNTNELKMSYIFNHLLNIPLINISKIMNINESELVNILQDVENLIRNEGVKIERNFKCITPNEICSLIDIFYEIYNKIYFSCEIEKGDKETIFLKIIDIFLSISKYNKTENSEIHAFVSYLYLKTSRLETVINNEGDIVTLREQDRSQWNRTFIAEGLYHLELSAKGENVTFYHLESGITACHSLAKSYEDTNWYRILYLYDKFLLLHESPYVELQRAIVISKVKNAKEAINCIKKVKGIDQLHDNPLLYSTLGNLNLQIHNYNKALVNYEKAFELSELDIDRKFYIKKIKICQNRLEMTNRYYLNKSF